MISSSNEKKKIDTSITKHPFFIISPMIAKGDVIFKRPIFFVKVLFAWFKHWLQLGSWRSRSIHCFGNYFVYLRIHGLW